MSFRRIAISFVAVLAAFTVRLHAEPAGTAFTFQGHLKNSGSPANGPHAMMFTLWNDPVSVLPANLIGPALLFDGGAGNPPPVEIANGLFNVALDFGTAFNGERRWLEIAVNGVPLTPRQELTPAPHAAFSSAPWITSGTEIHYSLGNVGIGTTNPNAKLQVDDGALRLRNNADNKNWELSYDATDNYFYVDEFGASRRFVIKNGGNVGIGTTNPNRHLVVKSPTALNESTWIQIDSGSVSSQYSGLELMDRGAAKWEVGKTPSNEFYVEEPGIARRLTIQPGTGNLQLSNDASISGVDQIIGFNDLRLAGDNVGGIDLTIRPNGNVGIGTTTPGNKLTVAGVIESTTGGVRFPDGSVQTTAFGGGGGGGGDFWTDNGNHIRNINAGNVGVGVVDPGSKLEVAGGVRAQAGNPTGTPAEVNSGYGFSGAPNSGLFAGGTNTVSLYQSGQRGLMVTPTGFYPEPSVHIGIDDVFDALIQTGRLNVRGLFDELSGTAITASGGDGWPAIHVEAGGDDAVGIFVQGSLGENSIGVHASGEIGISGEGETYGVSGFGPTGVIGAGSEVGVEGAALGAAGVGVLGTGEAVAIHGDGGIGVRATGRLYGIQAELPADAEIPVGHALIAFVEDQVNDFAATFHGKVHVNGMLTKSGGTFRIDHPLDPENKTLSHSFVESPDMMNVYNGNIVTDAQGVAWVRLPDYFEALNREFRYQLTVVDATDFAQARVFRKIQNNSFGIATSRPGVEVSWQVTGVRKDPWAEQNRVKVEEVKPDSQRGLFLNAEAYGQTLEKSLTHHHREEARMAANGGLAPVSDSATGKIGPANSSSSE